MYGARTHLRVSASCGTSLSQTAAHKKIHSHTQRRTHSNISFRQQVSSGWVGCLVGGIIVLWDPTRVEFLTLSLLFSQDDHFAQRNSYSRCIYRRAYAEPEADPRSTCCWSVLLQLRTRWVHSSNWSPDSVPPTSLELRLHQSLVRGGFNRHFSARLPKQWVGVGVVWRWGSGRVPRKSALNIGRHLNLFIYNIQPYLTDTTRFALENLHWGCPGWRPFMTAWLAKGRLYRVDIDIELTVCGICLRRLAPHFGPPTDLPWSCKLHKPHGCGHLGGVAAAGITCPKVTHCSVQMLT